MEACARLYTVTHAMEGATAAEACACLNTCTHAMEGAACYASFRMALAMKGTITPYVNDDTFAPAMEGAACYGSRHLALYF